MARRRNTIEETPVELPDTSVLIEDEVPELKNETPFNESIYEVAQDILQDNNISINLPEAKSISPQIASSEEISISTVSKELEPEDTKAIIDLAFDIPVLFTKWEGWKLSSNQSDQLARCWHPVLKRLLPKTENLDLIIAAIITSEILVEKSLEYKQTRQSRRSSGNGSSAGNTGIREDKLYETTD